MRLAMILVVGSITAVAGNAGAQAPAVPELGRDDLGAGSNPTVGYDANGKPAVAYINNGTNLLWSSSSGMGLSPVTGHHCVFNGQTIFCEDSMVIPPYPFPFPVMKGHDLTTSTTEMGTAGTLSDASWGNAVWVNAVNEVRMSSISGSGALTDSLIGTPAGGAPRPRLNGSAGVYQETAGAGWQLNHFVPGVGVIDSTLVPNEPRPDIFENIIVYQQGNSVSWLDADYMWDPKAPTVDPSDYGCSGFYDPQIGIIGFWPEWNWNQGVIVVRGEGCPENPNGSVLYVLDNPLSAVDVYYVGNLGSSHDFSVQDDQIAFVNDAGRVVWVQVDFPAL